MPVYYVVYIDGVATANNLSDKPIFCDFSHGCESMLRHVTFAHEQPTGATLLILSIDRPQKFRTAVSHRNMLVRHSET